MNVHLTPYRHAAWGSWMCPCGNLEPFPSLEAARRCDHPVHRPTSWWSEKDETILRGELAKLADLPRPAYLQRDMDRLAYSPITISSRRRWAREIGAWITIAGIALGIMLLLAVGGERPMPSVCPGDPAGCADLTATPATNGPPATTGAVNRR